MKGGFWPILIILIGIVVVAVGGYYLGWLGPGGLVDGEVCESPDGCQCGYLTKCAQWESCDRRGPFGSCRPR